jgi:mannose-6-phosphate isomerase-like protein (cupin superfamily)
MKQDIYLETLQMEGFPYPVLALRESSLFLDHHSHPYDAIALVLEGQIDIDIGGSKKTFLAGDIFRLQRNQIHTESTGNKGVKYLVSRKTPDPEELVFLNELDT